ncbi:MAG: HD domain-containing protein [Nitrospiraceae bacterium]|nr:HD domain-containing protein [Nitrospiraceae bacterium]
MDQKDLTTLKNWFAGYCLSFSMPGQEDQRNITIKKDHTYHVCLNALRIARDLNLGKRELLLAETIALLHDVGRFAQYQQYKTFDDGLSTNHAALGVKVLLEKAVLRELPDHEQKLILRAVTLHNVFTLPAELDAATRLFANLVRDADKLDIWRVLIEYYGQDQGSRATAVGLGLPDAPEYSPKVLASLRGGNMARKADLETLNDFKLLQLTWIYDLNFAGSVRMVVERGYIDKIVDTLPKNDEIRQAVEVVRAHVNGKLQAR